jgi:predicted transcriptional regulator
MDDKAKEFAVRARDDGFTWAEISIALGVSEGSVRYHVKGKGKSKQALKDTLLYKQYLSKDPFPEEKKDEEPKKVVVPVGVTAQALLVNDDESYAWSHRKPNKTLADLSALLEIYYRVKFAPNICDKDYLMAEKWIAWVYNRLEENFEPKKVS